MSQRKFERFTFFSMDGIRVAYCPSIGCRTDFFDYDASDPREVFIDGRKRIGMFTLFLYMLMLC